MIKLISDSLLTQKTFSNDLKKIATEIIYRVLLSKKFSLYGKPDYGLDIDNFLFSLELETEIKEFELFLTNELNKNLINIGFVKNLTIEKKILNNFEEEKEYYLINIEILLNNNNLTNIVFIKE